mmetsp:Transcript_5014/g.8724  ORF Transcript_5014/g.8724 Transcript_5014/m.8724 type:complete len:244 (-) Transcript_5014:1776-2507(-)
MQEIDEVVLDCANSLSVELVSNHLFKYLTCYFTKLLKAQKDSGLVALQVQGGFCLTTSPCSQEILVLDQRAISIYVGYELRLYFIRNPELLQFRDTLKTRCRFLGLRTLGLVCSVLELFKRMEIQDSAPIVTHRHLVVQKNQVERVLETNQVQVLLVLCWIPSTECGTRVNCLRNKADICGWIRMHDQTSCLEQTLQKCVSDSVYFPLLNERHWFKLECFRAHFLYHRQLWCGDFLSTIESKQ